MHSVTEITDSYFFDNGYWKCYKNRDGESIVEVTDKWRKLMILIFKSINVNKEMVTHELLLKALNGELEIEKVIHVPTIKIRKYPPKKVRPEGYLTVKERKEGAAKRRAERTLREAKYGRNVYRKPK